MALQKSFILLSGMMPARIFDKGIIGAQVHAHGFMTMGAVWNQFRRNFHLQFYSIRHIEIAIFSKRETLRCRHFANSSFIIVGFVMAWHTALLQAVVALGVEEPVLVESGFLELMIHVGG